MVIDMEALPEAGDEFGDACREAGADPLAWQLIGGDDYVLVACAEAIPSQGWWHIGEVTEGRGEVRIKRGKVTVDVEEYEIFRHF
jgi:thiamine monophosphate kinase